MSAFDQCTAALAAAVQRYSGRGSRKRFIGAWRRTTHLGQRALLQCYPLVLCLREI